MRRRPGLHRADGPVRYDRSRRFRFRAAIILHQRPLLVWSGGKNRVCAGEAPDCWRGPSRKVERGQAVKLGCSADPHEPIGAQGTNAPHWFRWPTNVTPSPSRRFWARRSAVFGAVVGEGGGNTSSGVRVHEGQRKRRRGIPRNPVLENVNVPSPGWRRQLPRLITEVFTNQAHLMFFEGTRLGKALWGPRGRRACA